MFFNSLEFLIFFPIVVGFYFLVPHRFRWPWLLAASYYFYAAWNPKYLILILISTGIDYVAALKMEQAEAKAKRRLFLILSLCSNLGMLFAFKYFNFFNDSLRAAFEAFNVFYDVPAFDVLLPVGISFYTFQTLSYTIDVYRGERKAERHLGLFALYVAFFPQLVAGPIERSTRLLPQFYNQYQFDYDRVVDGMRLMLWGFFKKMVIADHIAKYVDAVYADPTGYTGVPVWLATYFFAFQIYCDFSGYSDIAIGGAKVMGYNLMDNFRRPYFSKSIGEFWRRWHISLSTWFRDYLYIPLGGNRVSRSRWFYNLFIVFLISGLWHGANWTFVVWGVLHGLYLIFGIVTGPVRARIWSKVGASATVRKWVAVFFTFHLAVLAWVFFRANNITDAALLLKNMFIFNDLGITVPVFGKYDLLLAFAGIGFMEWVHLIERKENIRTYIGRKPTWFRWTAYVGVIMWILLFGVFGQQKAFIYFQF